MAVKHIFCMGIGFADAGDNLKYLPTLGFDIGASADGKIHTIHRIDWTTVIRLAPAAILLKEYST